MRKPVVVVSAAAALLLGGGFVATSAAADERPSPGWSSFWWPSLFGADDGFSDSPRGDFADSADSSDSLDASDSSDSLDASDSSDDQSPFDDRGPGRDDSRSGADGDLPDDDSVDGDSARGDSAQGDDHARQPQDRAALPPAPLPNPVQKPAQAATQPKHQAQPKQPRRAQRPAMDVMAGARQAVTFRDVSASPAAPVQQRVLRLINQNRRHGGCRPFTLDRRLIEAANEHAADMARRDYFAHESPRGEDAGDRVSDAGYRWKRYGENIARGADSAYEVVNGWMNSPSHRENILDCRLHEMGVGLAIGRDRTPYWVQDFATPQS